MCGRISPCSWRCSLLLSPDGGEGHASLLLEKAGCPQLCPGPQGTLGRSVSKVQHSKKVSGWLWGYPGCPLRGFSEPQFFPRVK